MGRSSASVHNSIGHGSRCAQLRPVDSVSFRGGERERENTVARARHWCYTHTEDSTGEARNGRVMVEFSILCDQAQSAAVVTMSWAQQT